ncbi:hypothetical protein D8B26_001271 [Coccidioides posadasii str. Silveira]|uniref:uncharacterized protein n=1 Tax=Coccidioides posadasii (strain RMSCC 757 / Silveira) TaxID=443226 RepID=UPI001BF02239|nr:hypothetical protein D8B26_001271 [Coccidioides posadasii str. Silveira]
MAPSQSLQAALSSVQEAFVKQNPQSNQAHKEACRYFPGGNTRSVLYTTPFPLSFQSGHGSTLTSVDGDTYTDFLGEYSAGIFGHSNPQIAEALAGVLSRGWNFGGVNSHEAILARKVCERFNIEMVRFTNSGTEANMMALAAALAFSARKHPGCPEPKSIVVFSNAYHGSTLSFPNTLVDEIRRGHDVSHLTPNLPHNFLIAPWNNPAETTELLATRPRGSIAAILVEPLQGAGGCRPASAQFLKTLRALADQKSALLIVDEVMTSRLAPGGLAQEWALRPDLITLGKWIGGGMSFGAFGGRRDVLQLFDPRTTKVPLGHAGTFNNNVLSMAAGCAGLDVYSAQRVARLNELGSTLKARLHALLADASLCEPPANRTDNDDDDDDDDDYAQRYPLETDSNSDSNDVPPTPPPGRMYISGYGSVLSIRFSGPDATTCHQLFFHHMLEEKIYLAARGYMALSLELSRADIEHFIAAVQRFVTKYAALLLKDE